MDNIEINKGEWAWGGLEHPSATIKETDVIILGVPFAKSAFYRKGAHEAPAKIRELAAVMSPIGSSRVDITNLILKDLGNMSLSENIEQNYTLILKEARKLTKYPTLPIFLGGDHSITIPLVAGFAHEAPTNIIMLDAHADLLDLFLGHRLGHANVLRRIIELPNLQKAYLIGIRSLEAEELEMLSHPKISAWTVDEFREQGISSILKAVNRDMRTYLTVDIDVVDPAFAPGTGIPDPGGITSYELLITIRELLTQVNVIGMDIVEYAPPEDIADITGFLCVKTIFEALAGLKRRKS